MQIRRTGLGRVKIASWIVLSMCRSVPPRSPSSGLSRSVSSIVKHVIQTVTTRMNKESMLNLRNWSPPMKLMIGIPLRSINPVLSGRFVARNLTHEEADNVSNMIEAPIPRVGRV